MSHDLSRLVTDSSWDAACEGYLEAFGNADAGVGHGPPHDAIQTLEYRYL